MNQSRVLKLAGATLLAVVLLLLLSVAVLVAVGGNWLRGPVERATLENTGRELKIDGDVRLAFRWPVLRVHAAKVRFANPEWAVQAENMLAAEDIELGLRLLPLLAGRIAIGDLTLQRADVSLEKNAEGRRNWLLDLKQTDENATIPIGRLALDASRIDYNEPARNTRVRAEVSTTGNGATLSFAAHGKYLGMPLKASGSGGSLLALRDESKPYPFKVDATIGPTHANAEGTVTGLSKVAALDVRVAVSGGSLAQLYRLLGIALPETPAYRTAGHIEHSGHTWRYEKFKAQVGNSDFAGTLQVDTSGTRPALKGEIVLGLLDMADLGPVIGTSAADTPAPKREGRVLPDVPFNTERWNSVDADVRISAARIVRPHELPLERFATHLRLRDSVLTLDPLEFGLAGGKLAGTVMLDGRRKPINAGAKINVHNIALDRLVSGFDTAKIDAGRIDGAIDLSGRGDSVARMLGTADGTAALLVNGGHVSRLVLEMIGLHVPEIIMTKLGGDQRVAIRCGLADFRVDDGVMKTRTLVLDTAITTVSAAGSVNLAEEKLNLTLVPQTKETSLISLRGPVHIRGGFAKPDVKLETGRIAARGLGAAALGLANPLLALIPLIEQGPGKDSDCGRLLASVPVEGGKGGRKDDGANGAGKDGAKR